MMSTLWIAKTGLEAQQINMNVIANNLANVNTTGFKRSHAIFEDLIYKNLNHSHLITQKKSKKPNSIQIGTGVRPIATEKIFTMGNFSKTHSWKNLVINGEGFFKILLPNKHSLYTRDGSFQINSKRQLVTHHGYVVSPEIKIPENAETLKIDREGIVTSRTKDSIEPQMLGQYTIFNFPNVSGLKNVGSNCYKSTSSSGEAIEGKPGNIGYGELYQGFLETSNVNVAEELVNMIQAQRAYEINSKVLTATDQMLQKLTQL
ncbi:flagellar basal-body rod protein FlgG [Buchnera aphidicola]|uniref:Flagellar basal-body rod protein FlgG n=1 Tax=Buchnera aphidicola subsp. Tuberolachnus salignus TaxID=98804 RepID=A0A160SYV1_BUCTT|nr:flagellar basal-body rod protein FlgG [Buchnera aphidicola]CUR53201.1 Flagellar basal-body rod protein FlgG [Buchnera aphidicola (Tuberolachnus salignus)]